MAECEILVKCPFFNDNMPDMPEHADLFKGLYCKGNNQMCARYMIYRALGREAVPADLFPHQGDRAGAILKQHGKTTPNT